MMNMANKEDKLVKHGWFKKPLGIASPVFYDGTEAASATSLVPETGLGGKGLETNDTATNGIIAALDLSTPTGLALKPAKNRGIVSVSNIQDNLLNVGRFKKTNESTVHRPLSDGKIDSVLEGTINFEVKLNKNHDGELKKSSTTKSTVADDVADILDWIRGKEETVSQGKRQQGMVVKAKFQENLMSKGWYSATGSFRVNTNTSAVISPEGVDTSPKVNNDIDIKNFQPKSDTSAVANTVCSRDYNIADVKEKCVDKKENINCSEENKNNSVQETKQDNHGARKSTNNKDTLANPRGKSASRPAKKFNAETERRLNNYFNSVRDFYSDNVVGYGHGNVKTIPGIHPKVYEAIREAKRQNLLHGSKPKAKAKAKPKAESTDKSSKKLKQHEKEINKLLKQGWTMTGKSRNQVTLVKLPEKEPSKTCIPDVKTNKSDNTKKTSRFRKLLSRFFSCGKTEE